MTDAQEDFAFDEDFFSPEELALMNGSDGEVDTLYITPTIDDLQAQLKAMATLVAEGCTREQELRVTLKGLRAADANNSDAVGSAQEQTEALARMVIMSCERERALQAKLAELRSLFAGNSVIDR